MHILYVEDHFPDFRLLEVESEMSPNLDIHLTWAGSLEKAESILLEENAIDLILLDLNLPDAEGLEGLKSILGKFPVHPIVVLTGNSNAQVGIEAIKVGAQDYLIKGQLSLESLYKTTQYALERFKINYQLKEAIRRVERLNDQFKVANQELSRANIELVEQKKLAYRQKEKMRDFSRLLSTDITKPLTVINSYMGVILSDKANLSSNQQRYLVQISELAEGISSQLLTLINTTVVNDGDLSESLSPILINKWLQRSNDSLLMDLVSSGANFNQDMPGQEVTVLGEYHALDSIQEQVIALVSGMVDERSSVLQECVVLDETLCVSYKITRDKAFYEHYPEISYDPVSDGIQPFRKNLLEQLMEAISGEMELVIDDSSAKYDIKLELHFKMAKSNQILG